ncbi:MAG: hypothetical protein JST82_16515 [Bacteroidetes bacterium]|nr:hypothetical protein [Bacteroidota bacterium]
MKKSLFILMSTVMASEANAQYYTMPEMDSIALRLPNDITVYTPAGCNKTDVKLLIGGIEQTALQDDDNNYTTSRYTIVVDTAGAYEMLIKCRDKIILRKRIYTKNIPIPKVNFAGKYNGKLPSSVVSKQIGLYCDTTNSYLGYKVSSFTLIKIDNDSKKTIVFNEGDMFNEKALNAVNTAVRGDLFFLRKIMVSCDADKTPRQTNDISIAVE